MREPSVSGWSAVLCGWRSDNFCLMSVACLMKHFRYQLSLLLCRQRARAIVVRTSAVLCAATTWVALLSEASFDQMHLICNCRVASKGTMNAVCIYIGLGGVATDVDGESTPARQRGFKRSSGARPIGLGRLRRTCESPLALGSAFSMDPWFTS